MIDFIYNWGLGVFGYSFWTLIWTVIKIAVVLAPLLTLVAYLTMWERVGIGHTQIRPGPNRVGPWGLLTPIADATKLIFKEVITPAKANKVLFYMAPAITMGASLAAWVVIPFGPDMAVANVNAGLLLLLSITSLEIYGIIIAGWASNSKYAFLGAMRASAQMISYELASFLCVISDGSGPEYVTIVVGQQQGMFASWGLNFLSWNWLPLLPIFVIYFTSGLAECNRHPFDVVEGESEIVAGHMIEYSGMGFAIFFLAEYANMILVSILTVTFFLGGWDAPFAFLSFIPGWIWLGIKTFCVVTMFLWVRATFPRYRYDQIMRLGWKVFIPVTLVWLVLVGIWIMSPWNIWTYTG